VAKISIVMTAYKRAHLLEKTLESIKMQTRQPDQIVVVEDGYDSGKTQDVCEKGRDQGLPVEYYSRKNRPHVEYSNAAIPKNIAIRKATGDILLIQCAEVKYTSPNDISNMVKPVEECGQVSMLATCQALDDQGGFQEWYAGPQRCEGWFLDFCQCVRRDRVEAIRGFDEGYRGYGFEDDDFAFRLQKSGVKYRWALDVLVQHQWHPHFNLGTPGGLDEYNRGRLNQMKRMVDVEGKKDYLIANKNLDWGNVFS
jgi:GT2 family glycosyltransferase